MRRACAVLCAAALVIGFGARPLWAHHSMGRSATPNTLHSYASQARPPETFLNFNTTADRLDGGLGYLWAYQLAGEYAIDRRFSMGGRLPVLSIREQFLPDTDGLGDIALSLKGLVAERLERRFALQAGTEVSFPTGSASKGTGAGNVMENGAVVEHPLHFHSDTTAEKTFRTEYDLLFHDIDFATMDAAAVTTQAVANLPAAIHQLGVDND